MPTNNEITLAKELIRFPSITPIDAGVMKFLAKKLTAIGFKCKILEFKDKKKHQTKLMLFILIHTFFIILFSSHMDLQIYSFEYP